MSDEVMSDMKEKSCASSMGELVSVGFRIRRHHLVTPSLHRLSGAQR
jgi:hypothetical protein